MEVASHWLFPVSKSYKRVRSAFRAFGVLRGCQKWKARPLMLGQHGFDADLSGGISIAV